MTAHALLAPSSASRWKRCLGSTALIAAATPSGNDGSSEFAREGTAAHTLAQRALDNDKEAEFFRGEEIAVEYTEDNETKIQTFIVDDEMIENVQVYLDQVRRQPGELMVEQKFDLSKAYGVEDQFGTGDAVILNYEQLNLRVGSLSLQRTTISSTRMRPARSTCSASSATGNRSLWRYISRA